jgi:hypothetical protein
MSRQEVNDTHLAHSRLSGECQLASLLLREIYMPRGRVGDGAPGGATVGGFHTLKEWTAMMIQITAFVPAVIAIYAATGAWVFSCDPISKTVDVVRGGLLYGWVGVLFVCTQVLVFQRVWSTFF